MSYPLVKISNSTKYHVKGNVEYASLFCSDDKYDMKPWGDWKASSRGVCLVTKITATVETEDGDVKATSYSSSGTSYSKFAVIEVNGNYEVTRRVSAMEDSVPDDYVEPTENQNC